MNTHSKHRPICPNCGYDLVFVALVVGPYVVESWLCDCGDPIPQIRDAVVEARNDGDQSSSVVSFTTKTEH